MKTTTIAYLTLALIGVYPLDAQFCATPQPTAADAAFTGAIVQDHVTSFGGGVFLTPVEIPLTFHIVRSASGAGDVSDSAISQTVSVMNAEFNEHNVFFVLNSVRRYNSDQYHFHDFTEEQSLKQAYCVSPEYMLNVIVVDIDGAGGYAVFPNQYPADSKMNAIVYDYNFLPGGGAVGNNTGKVLVHEMGHMLGLYHTFQGGCAFDGDYCADTPRHIWNNVSQPPENTDTCTSSAGLDPIHNHMNYTSDAWRTHFTSDQHIRMVALTLEFKTLWLRDYLWAAYSMQAGSWRSVGWFGWISDYAYPWAYHTEHGWFWSDSEAESSIYYWDSALGWCWTSDTYYPIIYRYADGANLYYMTGSGDAGSGQPRSFYNYSTGTYESVNPNQFPEF